MQITFIGHASLLVEIDGERLLTDPLLRRRVWHLRRKGKISDYSQFKNLSAILISHAHSDHLDLPSLKMLDENIRILTPRGTAKFLNKGGFHNVEEMTRGEKIHLGSISIQATHAEHNGARFRFDAPGETIGYLIDGSKRVYFSGDTELFPEMSQLSDGLDIALLPVWGWGPNLGSGHLNPYEAASALTFLKPRLAIPIHWGTFFPIGLNWIMPRMLQQPPRMFASFAEKLAPEVAVRILEPGQSLRLDDQDWLDNF